MPEANSLVLDLGISVTSYDGYSPPLPLPLFRTQIYKIYRGTKTQMKTKHLLALSHDRWIPGSPTPSSFYRTQIFFWIEKTKQNNTKQQKYWIRQIQTTNTDKSFQILDLNNTKILNTSAKKQLVNTWRKLSICGARRGYQIGLWIFKYNWYCSKWLTLMQVYRSGHQRVKAAVRTRSQRFKHG